MSRAGSFAGKGGQPVQQSEQRLLAGKVAQHPFLAVLTPEHRLKRAGMHAVDE